MTELLSSILVEMFLTPCGRSNMATFVSSNAFSSSFSSPSTSLHSLNSFLFKPKSQIIKPLEVEPKSERSLASNFN